MTDEFWLYMASTVRIKAGAVYLKEDITSWNDEIAFTQEQRIAKRINFKPWFFAKRVWAKLTNTTRPTLYDPAYSYVNLYSLPDGTIWRQYRPLTTWSGISRNPTFVLSRDGGNTWGKPVRFIKEANRSPYLVTAQQGNNIHFFFSDAHPIKPLFIMPTMIIPKARITKVTEN